MASRMGTPGVPRTSSPIQEPSDEKVGARRVARKLDLLSRAGFTVLHNRLLEPGRRWRIDHLVIGSTGVHLVEVVTWPDSVRVTKAGELEVARSQHGFNGATLNKTDTVNRVRGKAVHAAARLGGSINPVLVFAGARSRKFQGPVALNDVQLVSMEDLCLMLRTGPIAQADLTSTIRRANVLFPPSDI